MNHTKNLFFASLLILVGGCSQSNQSAVSPTASPSASPTASPQQIIIRQAKYTRTVPQEKVQIFQADILSSSDSEVVMKFSYPDVPNLSRTLTFNINNQSVSDVATEGLKTYDAIVTKANLRLSKKYDGKIYLEGDAIFDENTYPNLWVIEEKEPRTSSSVSEGEDPN